MYEAIKKEIERRTEILTRIYAEMVERKDDEMRTYYHGKIVALEEFLSFIESLEKEQFAGETMMEKDKIDTAFTRMMEKEQPKRKLRKVCNLREDLKADKPIEERLEELRHIRAEKDRLDDAAHNHAANNGGRWLTDDVGIKCFAFNPQEVEDAFKAGAKWMAGQGVTMTCTAVPTMLSNQPGESVFTADGLSWKEDELNVFGGDKVIVQIREA